MREKKRDVMKLTYKNKELILRENIGENERHLIIDDKPIKVIKVDDNKYYTPYLPYSYHPSVLELAKAAIDHVPGLGRELQK